MTVVSSTLHKSPGIWDDALKDGKPPSALTSRVYFTFRGMIKSFDKKQNAQTNLFVFTFTARRGIFFSTYHGLSSLSIEDNVTHVSSLVKCPLVLILVLNFLHGFISGGPPLRFLVEKILYNPAICTILGTI